MPPGGQDRGAAQAGALPSLEDGTLNATALMHALPAPAGEARAKAADRAWFSEHPDALSYVRECVPDEVHPLLLATWGGEPAAVAVAIVNADLYVRLFLTPGTLHATGRVWAEKAARKVRARLKRRSKGQR
ncbi:hypothetical protein GCM10008960_29460 [Deinococcus sedimenti]|uniref:Uncharacterized protein n=1 Tax=Deinococcus sedimenti TaxID=1867090 RepID=A0ABQ2S5Z0_9DEIO|nr:hypothetical protein GCM10008960_29460 [Deinococcus sedimenti]